MRTLIVLFCLSAFLLLAVGAVPAAIPPAAEPPAAEAPAAKPPAADAPAAEPPAAEAPAAEPPVAEAPAAEPPVAEAPAAETPAAEPPAAEPPAAEAPAAEPRAADPSAAEPPATETPPPEDAAAAPPSDASAPGSCKGDFKNQCIDCRTIAICAGEKEPLITKSCAALNPMTPYCDEGLCSSIAPGASCNADFRCSSPGYFPHPENCSKYYLCSAINGSAHEYDCGPNQIYDATKYTCEPRTPLSDCKVIDCSVAPNTYARHPGNPAYYAFCLNMPGHVETIMYKCANAKTSEFNMQRFSCEFSCPKEGRFPHDDCRRFYECYNTGLSIESSEWACPEGFYYDKRDSRCVPGKCK